MPFLADAGVTVDDPPPTPDAGMERLVHRRNVLRADWRLHRSNMVLSPSDHLLAACVAGDEAAATKALCDGADANAKTAMHTALGHAALSGSKTLVRTLLSAKADPDAINRRGESAAEAAMRAGNIIVAEELQHHQQHLVSRERAAASKASSTAAKAAPSSSQPLALPPTAVTATPAADAVVAKDFTDLDAWVQKEVNAFLSHGDEQRMRYVLQEDAKQRRAQAAAVMRSFGPGGVAGETLVVAFGGLQQRLGGGVGGGVPPYEFVRSCQRAGARHALFLRDPTRSWYCRGLGRGTVEEGGDGGGDGGGAGNGGGSSRRAWRETSTFDEMIEELQAEIRSLAPARVVTIGSSMGGYAAVRAGIALNADLAIAFSPQVLIEPKGRQAAALDPMHFDDLLSWLTVVGAVEGFELTSLVDAANRAPLSCRTRIELHVGATDAGDVFEAEMLVDAVAGRRGSKGSKGGGGGGGGGGSGGSAQRMHATLRVHPNRDHNLVVGLRDSGELHAMLVGWLAPGGGGEATAEGGAAAAGKAGGSKRGGGAGISAGPAGKKDTNKLAAVAALTAHASPAAAFESAGKHLSAGEAEKALLDIDACLRLNPTSSAAWARRAEVLVALRRYVDAMVNLQIISRGGSGLPVTEQATADAANKASAAVQQGQVKMGPQLAALAQAAGSATEAGIKVRNYERIQEIDPTNVYASFELASQRVVSANELQSKARQRRKGANSVTGVAIAREAHGFLHVLLDDIAAYSSEAAKPAAVPSLADLKGAAGGDKGAHKKLDAWLRSRRPNCPLPPQQHMDMFLGKVEMQLGMACDVVHAACSGGSSGSSIDGARVAGSANGGGGGGGGGDGGDGDGGERGSADGIERSLEHFERAVALDGGSWEVYDLVHHAIAEHPRYRGQPEAVRAAQAKVHATAVSRGVWGHPMQRPSHYIRGLLARPWHDPKALPPCRALLDAYPTIREEALELLRVDAAESRRLSPASAAGSAMVSSSSSSSSSSAVFSSYFSAVLEAGDWADVGLYYNGRRNEANAKRAPQTSELLRRNKYLRRDATSCPFGSAYFSLLRPGTRLGAHCGPTNGRLRAHLGLVVPDDEPPNGELRIICGGEERRWAEGEVLIFDDSFEHAVWNDTSKPRLVLIVDLWHPDLDTDEKRLAALNSDEERECYLGVAKRKEYGNTTQRGH